MPQVEEHRLHQLECQHCGRLTRAELPPEIDPSGYGPRVIATVAVLSGVYRHSQRMVQSAMRDLFGVTMCLGSVNRLRLDASKAVAQPVEEAQQYVQQQPVVGADETSWMQGNADGANQSGSKAWLWVAVTPLVTYFQVLLSRSTEAAQTLLGATFGGILTVLPTWGIQLGRPVSTAVMLGALEARIHQDIRAQRGLWAVGRGAGEATRKVIRVVASSAGRNIGAL